MLPKYQGFTAALTVMLMSCRCIYASALSDNESGFNVNTDLLASASIGAEGQNNLNSFGSNVNRNSEKTSSNNNNNNNVTVLENHICTREETYEEQLKIPTMQPVRIRTSNWCLEFPPRCSNYKTEMRQVMKVENVTKTRTIRFCCDGYAGNISINDTVCKPVCRGGCGRGYCQTPDVCSCEAGYTGKHCTQRCDHDHWGEECKNQCRCENGAACDNKSGICHCTAGWTGELCELPCPVGTYGVMCRKECDCKMNNTNLCHRQTGECLGSKQPIQLSTAVNTTNPQPEVNATHVMIQTLNSTINNITHNLNRIAKNLGNGAQTTTTDALTYLLPDFDVTTPQAVPEVIVIKQNEPHHTPKIIVHQPSGSSGQGKTPDVIHVITNWQNGTEEGHHLNLAGLGVLHNATPANNVTAEQHDSNILTTVLIILLIIMIVIAIGFLYVYRRYHSQRVRVEAALAERSGGLGRHQPDSGVHMSAVPTVTLGKSFLKPLPDLPAFTQMVSNKIEAPTYYDSRSSNSSSLKPPSYAYARKDSIYSVIMPKSRKSSADSHMYDEIRYPSLAHHRNQHHLQHHQHQLNQHEHSQQQQIIPELQVPTQHMNYLQVPQPYSHKVNHM